MTRERGSATRRRPGRSLGHRLWIRATLLLAVVSLPTSIFHPLWTAAFTVPGAVFYWLSTKWRQRGDPAARSTLALAAAIACQLGLFSLGSAFGVAHRPEVALTFLLLAPLGHAALHLRTTDITLSLFSALCLMLIGAALSGGDNPVVTLAFLAAASVSLRLEARYGARRAGDPIRFGRQSRRQRLTDHVGTGLAATCTALGLMAVMPLLPNATSLRRSSAASREVGVGADFELGGNSGPLRLRHDELVVARPSPPTRAVPTDLYLRAAFFTVPEMSRWRAPRRIRDTQRYRLHPDRWQWLAEGRLRHARTRTLRLEQSVPDHEFVWIPPHSVGLRGEFDVEWSETQEHAVKRGPAASPYYQVSYAANRRARVNAKAYPHTPDLLELPAGLPARYRELALEWSQGVPNDRPVEIARALIRQLGYHCTYSLAEPDGPYAEPLDNFLFGPSRSSYCMYFASALALLLRTRDVPCRIAVGLQGGEAIDDEPGCRRFGNQHAHAWVEIPLIGLGYTVFEPTPPNHLVQSAARWPSRAVAAPAPETAPASESSGLAAWFMASDLGKWLVRIVPWFGLLAIAAFLRFGFGRRRVSTNALDTPPPRSDTVTARRSLGAILKALRKTGLARRHGETLEHLANRVASRENVNVDAAAQLRRAFAAYQDVRFGAQRLTAVRVKALATGKTAVGRLRTADES